MRKIKIPKNYNYIGVFISLKCNLNCDYCINAHRKEDFDRNYKEMPAKDWIKGLNRLKIKDLPITLEGGEPTLHPEFYKIVNGIRKNINIDILTNLQFDVKEFARNINPKRLNRKDKIYIPIRASYHPQRMDLEETIEKIKFLKDKGFNIGLFVINHPSQTREIREAHKRCLDEKIYFWVKDFLGEYDGKLFGNYMYKGAVNQKETEYVFCRTNDLLIGPDGNIYRCHKHLYDKTNPAERISSKNLSINNQFRDCYDFGNCNPCDLKIRTNRFLQGNDCNIEIRRLKDEA